MDKKFQEAELLMERTLLLDWWDDERMRITNLLTERFVLLEEKISIEIDNVPIRKILSPAKYEQEVIEPYREKIKKHLITKVLDNRLCNEAFELHLPGFKKLKNSRKRTQSKHKKQTIPK